MTLKDKINSAKILSFGNPVGYFGPHSRNPISIIKQSDFDYFKPYIKESRKKSPRQDNEITKELKTLSADEYNWLFIFDGDYSYVVPDKVISSAKALDKLFRTKYFRIIGPQLNYINGKYNDFEGCDDLRLDIFGNRVDKASYKFHNGNCIYLEDSWFFQRVFQVETEFDDGGELEPIRLTISERKTRGVLLGIYNDEKSDYYDDVQRYFNDEGNIDAEGGFLFADDLDNNDELEKIIRDWIEEYLEPHEEGYTIKVTESDRWQLVKYENPLDFEIDC